jgi:hypothetical protein
MTAQEIAAMNKIAAAGRELAELLLINRKHGATLESVGSLAMAYAQIVYNARKNEEWFWDEATGSYAYTKPVYSENI